jgi:hypothetical protein
MSNLKVFFFTLLFFLNLSLVQGQEKAFKDGEWLSFKIKYGWFNASKASLTIEKDSINGKAVYHIVGFGQSTGLLDVFFKVRDRFETYLDPQSVIPYRFIRDTYEGGYTKSKEILFNHESNVATVKDYKHDTIHKHTFVKNSQDLLSSLYYLRNTVDEKTLKKGDEFELNMFFDEENFDFKVKYLGKEIIETKFGDVRCLVFKPYVKSGRVFKEQESVTIWISDDKNKIPLQIEAELAVGSLMAKLEKFKGLKHPFKIMM